MEKQNTSLFTRLKLYYKKKPVRVIIALIIIAGIMTGVAFGVITFVRALNKQDPCANEPGKTWNEDLNECIVTCSKDEKQCLVKGAKLQGQCISNDYCTGADGDGNKYSWDENTCECTLSCPDNQEAYDSSGKKHSTPFYDNKPVDPLQCGIKCTYDNEKGYCPPSHYCGEMRYEGPAAKQKDSQGCYPSTSYTPCSKDPSLICYSETPCYKSTNDKKYYCPLSYCSGKESSSGDDLISACQSNTECNGGRCIIGSDNVGSSDEDKKLRTYKQVGYCENSADILRSRDFCTTKKHLGEDSASSREHNKIKICNGKDDIGISLQIPQCINTPCVQSLCENGWEGTDGKVNCWESSLESAEELYKKSPDSFCCDTKNRATTPNGIDFCCPIKSGPNNLCTNNTEYGISKNNVMGTNSNRSDKEKIMCSVDEDCIKYNESFYEQLGINKNSASESNNPQFTSLYCDNKKGICKAWCGYFNNDEISHHKQSPFVVFNSASNEEYSWCANKTPYNFLPFVYDNGTIGNNDHPICKTNDGGKLFWTWDKNETMPYNPLDFYATGHVSIVDEGGKQIDANKDMCLSNFASKNYNIDNVTVSQDEIGSKNSCYFKEPCSTKIMSNPGGSIYNWMDPGTALAGANSWEETAIGEEFFSKNKIFAPLPSNGTIDNPQPGYYSPKDNCTNNKTNPLKSFNSSYIESPFLKNNDTEQCYSNPLFTNNNILTSNGIYCAYGIDVEHGTLEAPCKAASNMNIDKFTDINSSTDKPIVRINSKNNSGFITDSTEINNYPCYTVPGLVKDWNGTWEYYDPTTDSTDFGGIAKINDPNVPDKNKIYKCTNDELGRSTVHCRNTVLESNVECCTGLGDIYNLEFSIDESDQPMFNCPENTVSCWSKTSGLPLPYNCEKSGTTGFSCNPNKGEYTSKEECIETLNDQNFRCKCDNSKGISFPDPMDFHSINMPNTSCSENPPGDKSYYSACSNGKCNSAQDFYLNWLKNHRIALLIRSVPESVHGTNKSSYKADYGGKLGYDSSTCHYCTYWGGGTDGKGTHYTNPPPNYPARSGGEYSFLEGIGYPSPFKYLFYTYGHIVCQTKPDAGCVRINSNFKDGDIATVAWMTPQNNNAMERRSPVKAYGYSNEMISWKVNPVYNLRNNSIGWWSLRMLIRPLDPAKQKYYWRSAYVDFVHGGELNQISTYTHLSPMPDTHQYPDQCFCFTQLKKNGPILLAFWITAPSANAPTPTKENLYPSWATHQTDQQKWYCEINNVPYGYLPFLFSTKNFQVYPLIQEIDSKGLGKIKPVPETDAYFYEYKGKLHSYDEDSSSSKENILHANTINSFCTMPNDLTASDDKTCSWAE